MAEVLYQPHHDVSNDLEAARAKLVERIVGRVPEAVVEAIVVVDQVNSRNSSANEWNVVIHHSLLGRRQVFAVAEFYRRFSPIAMRKGWLRLYALFDEGAFKAVQVGYVYRNVFYQLQEGFDPAYVNGVGNVLRAKVIEACIDEGLEGYDFLGDMSEHKRRWLATLREGRDLLIGRSTLKNLLLSKPGVWPSGRYMRQVSPAAGIE